MSAMPGLKRQKKKGQGQAGHKVRPCFKIKHTNKYMFKNMGRVVCYNGYKLF